MTPKALSRKENSISLTSTGERTLFVRVSDNAESVSYDDEIILTKKPVAFAEQIIDCVDAMFTKRRINNMKEIYIVSSGVYSDYGIDGVFSTKELAQAYIDALDSEDSWNEMNIETWELDPHKEDLKTKRKVYFVRMSQNGEALEVKAESSAYGIKYKDSRDWVDRNGNFCTYCFADDEKHAIKICAERKLTSKFK